MPFVYIKLAVTLEFSLCRIRVLSIILAAAIEIGNFYANLV